jgi:xylulokinase
VKLASAMGNGSGAGERHVLALDLGTTALKVALATTRGRILDTETEPQHVTLLPGGGAEQDPEDWWTSIVHATKRLLDRNSRTRGSIVAVNVSAQWSGTVAVGEGDSPIRPAIIWMDSRGASEAARITDGLVKVQGYGVRRMLAWIRVTGGGPTRSGKDPVAHILWLKSAEPDAYAGARLFLEPKDWLNLRLTGRAVSSFDAITLHWVTDSRRIGDVRYDERLLRMAGLDRERLPALVPPATVIGTLTERAAGDLDLPEGTKVVSGMGDVVSAAIGSGAVAELQPHLCVGTSSWLTCHVSNKKTDLNHNMASLPSGLPGRYFVANEQESAGVCLTYLKDRVLFDDETETTYADLDRLATTAPAGSNGLVFTPWLNGERTPVDDSRVRGGFFNQTLQSTRADMVRAVLEGVAFNSRWLMQAVERFVKRRFDDGIRMIGGGATSDVWCQIIADVLDRPILRVEQPVFAGARGAALQAGLALGDLPVEEIPDAVPIDRTFRPNPEHRARYDRMFGAFIRIYERTKPIYARLNG